MPPVRPSRWTTCFASATAPARTWPSASASRLQRSCELTLTLHGRAIRMQRPWGMLATHPQPTVPHREQWRVPLSKTTCARRPAETCHCRFARLAPRHHDVLLNAEADVATTLELLELATTWEELDYSDEAVIPPCDWMDFAAAH